MKHIKTISAQLPQKAMAMEMSKKCMKKPSKPGCPVMYSGGSGS